MRGRRSSRSAAVVMAGCVGLAVMAPGLALARPMSGVTTQAACTEAHGIWNATTRTCDDGTGGSTAGSSGSTGGSGGTSDTSTVGGTPSGSSDTTTTTTTEPSTGSSGGVGTTGGAGTTGEAGTTEGGAVGPVTSAQPAPAETGAISDESATARTLVGPSALTSGDAASLLGGLTTVGGVTGLDLSDVVPLPAGTGLPFSDGFTIPIPPANGLFTSPRDACAYLAGSVPAPAQGADQLAAAFESFCGALPASFTGFDPTSLIQDLLDIMTGLIPSLPGTDGSGPIPATPPSTVPDYYHAYWTHRYDVDCPELTYEEANAILAGDPSDPFHLDGDNDGVACEDNAHGYVVAEDYVGYPVGGVATGDGSTGHDASGVEVALAAGALSGLALTALAVVRRFAREG